MRNNRSTVVITILIVLGTGILGLKVFSSDFSLERIIPEPSYSLNIVMTFTGNGEDIVARTFLPKNETAQSVRNEVIDSGGLQFRREVSPNWDMGEWRQKDANGAYRISYSCDTVVRPVIFDIDPEIVIPPSYPENFNQYLAPTEFIQSDDPIIRETLETTGAESYREVLPALESLYEYVANLGNRPFKGTTDAVTAARLGAASCNGKSRLFIAMARRMGIPSRLVGGLILNTGVKKTSHQWVEVYVAGHWVPIDALNGHFAELPGNYLVLYRGDEALFRHSRNIGFDYQFDIRQKAITNDRLVNLLGRQGFSIYNLLNTFLKGNVSFGVLQFLLVIPLGVLVVVFARNIVGISTLGTFLPALMAMAIRGTGLGPGLIAFVFVITITVLIRFPLDRLGILHTPKLAILMVVVIIGLLGLSALAGIIDWDAFSTIGAASVFPIAILTITAERLAITIVEEGYWTTFLLMVQTLAVTAVCFIVMDSVAFQALMVAFPELLLIVVAANLWIGNWTGMRVIEMFRFRSLYIGDSDGD